MTEARTSPPPYGDEAARLVGAAAPEIASAVEAFSARFRDEVATWPGPREVLARLTGDELARLLETQACYLLRLLSPDASEAGAREREARFGRSHLTIGIEPGWYVGAIGVLHDEITGALATWGTPEERAAVGAVVRSRLHAEVVGVLGAAQAVEDDRNKALRATIDLAGSAETVVDLARGVLDILSRLDGFAAGYFGRPDSDGTFRFEVATGPGIDLLDDGSEHTAPAITTRSSDVGGKRPAGRAWRGGRIERSDAYLSDPTTAPWHELGRHHGWRSSAAVPLLGRDGTPRALLSFYGTTPGLFATRQAMAMLEQIQVLVGHQLEVIEARPRAMTRVVSRPRRVRHLELLARGEVVMLYQPVVDLATGAVNGFEALARLREDDDHLGDGDNGTRRLLSPAEFLPSLGEADLALLFELGLDQALADLQEFELAGLRTNVSLNMPASGLASRRYVDVVESTLATTGVDASRLTLELLEYDEIDQASGALQRLLDLKSLGVRLAEDDLGSGYSSLLRLRDVPFDQVKIDQELVRGAETSSREALSFIEPLTNLAHRMGVSVVVEGLESIGLIEAAVYLGADAGQGYGIARPMAALAVLRWARDYHLDVGRDRPTTGLGGLAAHLAWEGRLAALSSSPGWAGPAPIEVCGLTAFIRGTGAAAPQLDEAHRALHAASERLSERASYDVAWDELHRRLKALAQPA